MSKKSDKERRKEAEAELEAMKAEQAQSQAEAAWQAEQEQNKPKSPVGMWLGIAIAVAIAAGVAFVTLSGGEEVTLSEAEQILEYQTACFEADLFYDGDGACFDDAELTQRNTSVNPSVVASAGGSTPTGLQTPAAPAAPAAPSSGTTTTTSEGPSEPTTTTTSATTATTTAAATTTTTSTTTTTTTTTAPAPAINIDRAGWVMNLTVLAEDGVPCDSDPKPSHCNDAISGQHSIEFEVVDGSLSGSKFVSSLGQTVAINGMISPDGSLQYLTGELQNSGGDTQSFIEFTPGSLIDSCNISGNYAHTTGNPGNRYVMSGTYTMSRSSPGC